MAAVFQQRTRFPCIAGLWKEDVRWGFSGNAAPRSEPVQAPEILMKDIAGPPGQASSALPVAYSRVVGYESAAVVGFDASEEDQGLVSSSISQLDLNPIGEVASASMVVRAMTRA